jgi:hypothetical protein
MAIPNATHQAGCNTIASLGDYISLHTSPAGTTGANEASGGGYSRQLSTPWTPDGTGDNNSPQVNLPCAAGTYVEAGIWSTASGSVLSVPSGVTAAPAAGGSFTTSTTGYFKITAFNWAGETTASAEVSATFSGSNLAALISWSAVAGVHDQTGHAALFAGTRIYYGSTSGSENVLVATVAASATSYTVTSSTGTSASPPVSNTASTFVGSAALLGGSVTVTGSGASINVSPSITA